MPLRTLLARALGLAAASTLVACLDLGTGGGDDGADPPDVFTTCPAIFAQDLLPEYQIEVAPAEWAALTDEFVHRAERAAAGLPEDPYHPITFTYAGETVPGVLLRLKGASSWWDTIAFDANPKMQFVIAFNEVDRDARWFGVRKLELDMPRSDASFLRQRVALYALRQMGLPAQCANSARLVINGAYYGLFTNLERMDKEFLQLRYPGDDDGDLWKGGRILKTNEDSFSWTRIDRLWHATTTATQLADQVDMAGSLAEWAGEAVIGDADGYYNGRANFYLYDHPSRGFIWIPQDLDTAFAELYLPHDASLVIPVAPFRWEPDWRHYLLVMADPDWQETYVAALATARDQLDVDALQVYVDRWADQIRASAEADPHRPFAMAEVDLTTADVRGFIAARARFVDRWLACRQGGGADADGDGFRFCFDCDDAAADTHPGAVETCDGRDQDCDGHVDDLLGGTCG